MGQTLVPPCLEVSSDCDLICNPKFTNPNCEGLFGDIWMPAYDLIGCCAGPPNPSIYPSCHPFPGWDNIYRSPDYISEGLPTPNGDNKAMRMGTYFDETCPLSEGLITEVNVQPNKNYMLIYTRTGYGYPYLVGGGSGEPLMQLVELCSDCNSNYEGALAQSINRLYFRLTNAANIPWDLDADMMCNPALNPPTNFVTITPGGISNNSESFTESDLEANIIMGMPWRKNSLCFSTGTDDTWDRLYLYPEMDYLGAWFIIDEVRLYEDDFPTLPTDYYVCPGDAVTIGSSFCEDAASDIVFSWEVFDGSTWQPLTGETQPTLTIFPTLPVTLYRLTRTLQPYPTAPLLDGSSCVNTQVEITVHLTEPPVGEEIDSPQELACCLQNTNFLIHQNSGGLTMVYDNMAYTVQNSGTWSLGSNELETVFGASGGILRINTDIIIPADVEIRLESITFEFGPQGRFIVQRGGSLVLGGNAYMQGLCNSVWQGIQVEGPGWGNQRQVAPTINYGRIYQTSNSDFEIRDAIIAIAGMRLPLIDVNAVAYDVETALQLLNGTGIDLMPNLTAVFLKQYTNSPIAQSTSGGVVYLTQESALNTNFQGINLSWFNNSDNAPGVPMMSECQQVRFIGNILPYPFNVLPNIGIPTSEAGIYAESYSLLRIYNNNRFTRLKYGIRTYECNNWKIGGQYYGNVFETCNVGVS
ncbi:MAG TPA: hypothetical protein PK715_13480, partial [Chitinophagales bacterium]|nr:hypothetical protein [Chitinophagales bacterium]